MMTWLIEKLFVDLFPRFIKWFGQSLLMVLKKDYAIEQEKKIVQISEGAKSKSRKKKLDAAKKSEEVISGD